MNATAGHRPHQPYVAIGSSKRKRSTVQTLGAHTYALPDTGSSTTVGPTSSIYSMIKTTLQLSITTLIVVPFLTVLMSILPSSIKHHILGKLIPSIMEKQAQKTQNQRKLLLQHVQGRVLDVGSGGGAYLRHLGSSGSSGNTNKKKKKASHVVCLEPVSACHETIRKAARKAGFGQDEVTIVEKTLETYEPNVLFDWILLGNVLCEVPDQMRALEKVDRMLRPGGSGHVYFCEHVCSPPGTWKRTMQHWINPCWRRASGGCNCNRDTLEMLEHMGDRWDLVSWEITHSPGPFGSPVYMGLAKKAMIDA